MIDAVGQRGAQRAQDAFDPARMCAETLATLDALERAWTARAKAGDRESKALLRRMRRQRRA